MPFEGPKTLLAAWISLISNLFLTLIKVFSGTFFHSTALIADGVHNGGDVIASIATIGSMKVSNHPADREHPYGHGKAEDIATAFIAIILGAAALFLIFDAVKALLKPAAAVSLWALAAAVISAIWKWVLYVYTAAVGKRNKSKSLMATASDHLADIYASLAAVVGLGIAWIGDWFNLPYTKYGDPIAGIIVSVLILRIAIVMAIKSTNVLMESNVKEEQLEQYRQVFLSFPEVKRIDRLRAREHGNYILIDARIGLPANMTIKQGHDITQAIRNRIMSEHEDVEEVLIHLNPWYPDTMKHNQDGHRQSTIKYRKI